MTLARFHSVSAMRLFGKAANAIVISIGAGVLAGRMFDVPALRSILAIPATTKASTAIALLFMGVSLGLQQNEQAHLWARRMAKISALVVSLIGGLTFVEYLSGWDIGIDNLLFQEPATSVQTSHPGRMGLNTALCHLLLGLALLLLDAESRRGVRPAQLLALTAGSVAFTAFAGHLFRAGPFYRGVLVHWKMGVHSSVALLAACVGILFARPDKGFMAYVTGENAGGALARRLLPAVLITPIVFGWLRLIGERAGLYDTELGLALMTSLSTILLGGITVSAARMIYRADVQRTRAEEALRDRTAEVEAANKELEAFSYSVSHDLRAPLRAVDGFSRILLEDQAGKLGEEGRRLLDIIRRNIQTMGQLIDDLLAFSRMGRQELRRSEINMTALAGEVFEELRRGAPGRDLRCRIAPLPVARGDRAMMRQVWMNLLSNAVKYTRSRAPAEIEVGAHQNDHETTYMIRDNGVGFDMQYVDKLFGVFQRLHRQEEFEGTGVGLAVVQRIIHRHGGRVWAEGKVNGGATFYFTLPARR